MKQFIFVFVLFTVFDLSNGEMFQPNCSDTKDGRKQACYTCMGRDLENCQWGHTCCKGSCFKLVDNEHELIVKGCTGGNEEDSSMKIRELDVKLYWTKNEKVKGESYFCKGNQFCNGSSLSSIFISFIIIFINPFYF